MFTRNCLRVLVALLATVGAATVPTVGSPCWAAEEESAKEPAGASADSEGGSMDASADQDAEEDGGHHDPYELGHGNAGALIENPIEPRFDMAVATFLVFLMLLGLLTRFAWRPIMDGLDRREAAIAQRIAEAEATAEAAAEQLKQYQQQMAAASDEAQAVITQARKNAESIADKIRDDARQDAERERGRAVADIRAAKSQALREVAQASADMAVGLAGRILQRELRPDDHAALIREALERFPSQN